MAHRSLRRSRSRLCNSFIVKTSRRQTCQAMSISNDPAEASRRGEFAFQSQKTIALRVKVLCS